MPESENPIIEERDINNYFPAVVPLSTLPIYFSYDIEKRILIFKIKTFLTPTDWNQYKESFSLLDDEIAFSGSSYDGLLSEENNVQSTLNSMIQRAREIGKFKENDKLKKIIIDSENTLIELEGERILSGSPDLLGDPTKKFGRAQDKFTLLVNQNPDFVVAYYKMSLGIFAQKSGPRKRFYQLALEKFIQSISNNQG